MKTKTSYIFQQNVLAPVRRVPWKASFLILFVVYGPIFWFMRCDFVFGFTFRGLFVVGDKAMDNDNFGAYMYSASLQTYGIGKQANLCILTRLMWFGKGPTVFMKTFVKPHKSFFDQYKCLNSQFKKKI